MQAIKGCGLLGDVLVFSTFCSLMIHCFFCRATVSDCTSMADILSKYKAISGQKVNLLKSSLIFGKRVPHHTRQLLQNILNIYSVGGGGKYLGMPEQFNRSKVQDFRYLVERVKGQLDPWYNQYLSQADKEVLIKSILQAKPV